MHLVHADETGKPRMVLGIRIDVGEEGQQSAFFASQREQCGGGWVGRTDVQEHNAMHSNVALAVGEVGNFERYCNYEGMFHVCV